MRASVAYGLPRRNRSQMRHHTQRDGSLHVYVCLFALPPYPDVSSRRARRLEASYLPLDAARNDSDFANKEEFVYTRGQESREKRVKQGDGQPGG
jgi:hypothetical protein